MGLLYQIYIPSLIISRFFYSCIYLSCVAHSPARSKAQVRDHSPRSFPEAHYYRNTSHSLIDRLSIQRFRKKESLSVVHLLGLEPHPLVVSLNAFGNRLEPEKFAKLNQRVNDGCRLLRLRHSRNEGLIDLEYVDRELA